MRSTFAVLAGLVMTAGGCEPADPAPMAPPLTPAAPAESPWRPGPGSTRVAVAEGAILAELEAASAQARSLAGEARRRWEATPPAERGRWAVKWAAPTVTGGVEQVWVRPVSWTAHRIEGTLAGAPTAELECGRTAGELVALPADELTDWVVYLDGTTIGRREGGFTIDVLERHFGPPG